jgi:hypothetical protein
VLNDGVVIPIEGVSSFATGRYPSKVPIILGGNLEEEYLASFARTGDPNPPGSTLPKWLPWSSIPGTMEALVFDAGQDALALSISTKELTDAVVLKAANADLVEPLRGNVLRHLDQMKNPWGLR